MNDEAMKRIIEEHYALVRQITDEELASEVKNLERRRDHGTLDDRDEKLAAKLHVI